MTNFRRTSRGPVSGGGPAVEKHCLNVFYKEHFIRNQDLDLEILLHFTIISECFTVIMIST
jgi:hypothetical protein